MTCIQFATAGPTLSICPRCRDRRDDPRIPDVPVHRAAPRPGSDPGLRARYRAAPRDTRPGQQLARDPFGPKRSRLQSLDRHAGIRPLPAFRPRARRRGRNTHRTCHEMSCFVMRARQDPLRYVMRCHVLHACGAYPASRSGMGTGYSIRFLRLRVFGMGLSFRPVSVPFFPPSGCRSGGTLFRAYPARACAGAGACRRRRGSRA